MAVMSCLVPSALHIYQNCFLHRRAHRCPFSFPPPSGCPEFSLSVDPPRPLAVMDIFVARSAVTHVVDDMEATTTAPEKRVRVALCTRPSMATASHRDTTLSRTPRVTKALQRLVASGCAGHILTSVTTSLAKTEMPAV